MSEIDPEHKKLTKALVATNIVLAIGVIAMLMTDKSCTHEPEQLINNVFHTDTVYKYIGVPVSRVDTDTVYLDKDNPQPDTTKVSKEPDKLGTKGNIGCLDIVMCIDCTGSMSGIINMVKDKAINFYDDIKRQCHSKEKEIESMRVKVIAFRDFRADGSAAFKQSSFYTLPSQKRQFKSFVSSLQAAGGGDLEENGLEALGAAIKSNWTKDGEKLRHAILLWSDVPPHPIGEVRGSGYPSGIPTSMSGLKSAWNGSGIYQKGKCLILFTPEAALWKDVYNNWDNTFHANFTSAGYERVIKKIADTI